MATPTQDIISRQKVIDVCAALGYSAEDVYSIALTGTEVSVCLFERNENGARYFADPTGLLGYAKRFENFKIEDEDEEADRG